MAFGFHANIVCADARCRRLSFLDRDDDASEHYFIMDRSEESPEIAVPNMDNVYVERDDQMWGGYGGIEHVILDRDCLTLHLGPKLATKMGEHDVVRITFAANAGELTEIKHLLGLIMLGYESRLDYHC